MEPVGELVRLGAQGVGEALDLDAGGEPGQLGGVAERCDMADLAAADADRAPARHQHPLAGQQHLVLVVERA